MNPHPHNGNRDDQYQPPYSRLFVVCPKDIQEDVLRKPFEEHGEIEDIYMPKDHNSGGHKGIAYIKFLKTSSAAAAIQALHNARIGPGRKPIKVMLASNNKNDKIDHSDTEKFKRLFVKVPKELSSDDIKEEFSKMAPIEKVHLQKHRGTSESKGLAYVEFETFHGAAIAYEKCDRKYKAVFATPKPDLKRTRDSNDNSYDENFGNKSMGNDNMFDQNNGNNSFSNFGFNNFTPNSDYNNYQLHQQYFQQMNSQNMNQMNMMPNSQNMMNSVQGTKSASNQTGFNTVIANCTPIVLQKYLEALFNIIPDLQDCQYSVDINKNDCTAIFTYKDPKSATYAVERLNNFEFPSGEVLHVTAHDPLSKAASDLATLLDGFKQAAGSGNPALMKLTEAISEATMFIKAARTGTGNAADSDRQMVTYCSVPLPPLQPLGTGRVAQRCFIVCRPQPPANNIMRDVFCRFGDLLDLSFFPNKTFGFAKYGSVRAAEDAINTLNRATVCGVYLKVLKADDKPEKDNSRNHDNDEDIEYKRMKREEIVDLS